MLAAVLPFDAAGLHAEGQRWQGLVVGAVAGQRRVAGRRLGLLGACDDLGETDRPAPVAHGLDHGVGLRLLGADIGKRD